MKFKAQEVCVRAKSFEKKELESLKLQKMIWNENFKSLKL